MALINKTFKGRYQLRPDWGVKDRVKSLSVKALDTQTDQVVVVKFVLDQAFWSSQHTQPDLKKLNHPNLLKYHSQGIEVFDLGSGMADCEVLVSEYVSGAPVSHHYARFADLKFLTQVFRKIMSALGYLHKLGWVHGDVKSANIFLFDNPGTGSADVKIMDLDNMLRAGEPQGLIRSTPEYAAPEIFVLGVLTDNTDWWSLGCVLYELLTRGNLPFGSRVKGQSYQDIRRRVLERQFREDGAIPVTCRSLINVLLRLHEDVNLPTYVEIENKLEQISPNR